MRIGIIGIGAMGTLVYDRACEKGYEAVYVHTKEDGEGCDLFIDFSHPSMLSVLEDIAKIYQKPFIICTTGFTPTEEERILQLSSRVPVLYTQNTSLGVTVLSHLVKEATRLLGGYDIEIVEKHHHHKVDAPSGTAMRLARAACDVRKELTPVYGRHGMDAKRGINELGVHALRGGSIVGEHSVLFAGMDEVIEVKHEAFSKKLFVEGALRSAEFFYTLTDAQPKMYTMEDVLGLNED